MNDIKSRVEDLLKHIFGLQLSSAGCEKAAAEIIKEIERVGKELEVQGVKELLRRLGLPEDGK